jgi:hypothetical protein
MGMRQGRLANRVQTVGVICGAGGPALRVPSASLTLTAGVWAAQTHLGRWLATGISVIYFYTPVFS